MIHVNKDKLFSVIGSRKVWISLGGIATAVCALLQVDPTISANIVGLIVALGASSSIIIEKITGIKDVDSENEISK